MLFARTALRSLPRTAGRRSFATEPINAERGDSKTPYYIAGALAVIIGGYLYAGKDDTAITTPATKRIEETAGKGKL